MTKNKVIKEQCAYLNKQFMRAFLTRDPCFDGVFLVGVNSTKIFCLPSCRAKLPSIQQVVFFNHEKEAISSGFRPCKQCQPSMFLNHGPSWLHDCISFLASHLDKKISENELSNHINKSIQVIRKNYYTHSKTLQKRSRI